MLGNRKYLLIKVNIDVIINLFIMISSKHITRKSRINSEKKVKIIFYLKIFFLYSSIYCKLMNIKII